MVHNNAQYPADKRDAKREHEIATLMVFATLKMKMYGVAHFMARNV
jgi:hypothetical protein